MPRLRNTANGVVVNVNDATAARLGRGWEVADDKAAPTPALAEPGPARADPPHVTPPEARQPAKRGRPPKTAGTRKPSR